MIQILPKHQGFIKHQLSRNSTDLSSTTFSKKASAGFTLIEIIIVISVLAVLSIVGIAAFASYSRAQTLNAAAGDLAVMLNLAKSRAYSQVKPNIVPCTSNPLDGYRVTICGGTQTCSSNVDYKLDVVCSGQPGSSSMQTGKLPANFSFSGPSQGSLYFFPVLKGGVVISPVGSTINITGYNNSLTKSIIVDSSGNIRIN